MANIGGAEEGGDQMISGINVTPLVDVTLVLLIIFMVTASYIVKEAIEVDLPHAANAGEAVGRTFALVLTKQGDLYLDGARCNEQELLARVRDAAARDHQARAAISADRAVLHGAVVRVIDILKEAGISRFAINVEKSE